MRVSTRRTQSIGKGDDLNAEIVFEIKDGRLVTEAGSKFTAGRGDRRVRLMVERILGLRRRLQTLLFDSLFCRNCNRDVAGRTGFACIVRRLRAAGRLCWLTQRKLCRDVLRPRRRRDPQAGQEQRENRPEVAARFHTQTVALSRMEDKTVSSSRLHLVTNMTTVSLTVFAE
jgi:hypothetical protein